MVPRSILMKTGLKTVNSGRQTVNTGRQNVNTVRARGFNAVKPSAYWVWIPIKPNAVSLVFNKYNYIDARGRSNPKKTAWEQFSSNIAAAIICLATNRRFNFSRMIFDHMVSNISSPVGTRLTLPLHNTKHELETGERERFEIERERRERDEKRNLDI
ncbi:hypothetical protein Tco_0147029 [Tanacetum coccineum]